MRKSPSALYKALFFMEALQRYICIAMPWRVRKSPAPHIVCKPLTKSTSAACLVGTSNGFHRN